MKEESIYSFEVDNIKGQKVSLDRYKGKVLLIVNTASQCGLTPQYKGLQELYSHYKSQGFEILAFPCNQFGEQEPGDASEISSFCQTNYQTTFPLFSKIDVNGENAHELYQYLKKSLPGLLGIESIKWNFTKFLIDRSGQPVKRFAPTTTPESISHEIDILLRKPLEN